MIYWALDVADLECEGSAHLRYAVVIARIYFKVSKPEVLHIKMNHKTYNIHHVETEPSEGGVPGGQLL